MYNFKRLKKPVVIYLIISLLIIIIATIFIFLKNQQNLIDVTFNYMPKNCIIIVDNKNIDNNSQVKLTPGEHLVTVSSQGYETSSFSIMVTEKNNSFFGILNPNSDNDEDTTRFDAFMQEKIQESNEKIESYYPIIQFLPNNSTNQPYSIHYTISDDLEDFKVIAEVKKDKKDIIFIDYDALRKILNNIDEDSNEPYDLTPYSIVFLNFENQFNDFIENNETDPKNFILTGLQNYYNINNLEISNGINDGEYYYTSIEEYNPNKANDSLRYGIILRKNNNGWELAARPELVFTTKNTNNIPSDILHKANNYSPNTYFNKAER